MEIEKGAMILINSYPYIINGFNDTMYICTPYGIEDNISYILNRESINSPYEREVENPDE